ncbi:MAG: MaoC family dehydratase [Oryzihumus sp.]
MGDGTNTLNLGESPSLAGLFARAALTARGRSGPLPDLEVLRAGVRVDRTHLAAYDRVCGFTLHDTLPATYLHVLVFPLQVTLMAEPGFPLALPGLVHLRQRLAQHRPVVAGVVLDLRATATALRPHPRGAQVDLVGEVRAGDELVWEGRSTYLSRGAAAPPGDAAPEAPLDVDVDRLRHPTATWRVPADQGRRYAAVSGDVNPIHLNPLAAKAFGFPRAIAHGLWTMAHALASVEARLPERYAADVVFRGPVLLPSTVDLLARPVGPGGWDLMVRSGDLEHLRGTVRPG